MRDDGAYLQLISESIALVRDYISAMAAPSVTVFAEDLRTQDATLRRLEILADATSHLSGALKARHPMYLGARSATFAMSWHTRTWR